MSIADDSLPRMAQGLSPVFLRRVFITFALMALAAAGISLGGKLYGRSIAMGGHTDSQELRQIAIGSDLVVVSENAIRFPAARRDGISGRLDLYFHWPEMTGYSSTLAGDFNHVGAARRILFLSFEERSMSRDMSGRFEPIYRELIQEPGIPGTDGLTHYGFSEKSGYLNEELVVGQTKGEPFVARCLTGGLADESLAPCARDIQLGENLSLSYRFPRELLAHWQALDASIRSKAVSMVRPTRPR